MVNLENQNNLFELIGKNLKEEIDCFVIGGSAMLYYGTKDATKDIDLVFTNNKQRETLVNILKNLGFVIKNARILYLNKKNIPILMQRGEERIDLFNNEIICFELSENIIKRVEKIYEFSNLIVKIIAPEDIILLKCATERAGDRKDALEIIKKFNIKWDTIIQESLNQIKLNKPLFPVFLYEFLQELKEDLDADIPKDVLKRLRKISEEVMIKRLKERGYKKL